MSYNDDLPTWGATGSKPPDGTSRSPGDNIDASEYNYLWYILNETFGDIDADISNIETGGVVDNPHGNGAHDPDFLPEADYDPTGDINFAQLLLNNPHDNRAHNETYLTDTYDPSTDLNFPSILEQTGNKHDNAAHSENYATTAQLAEKADHKHGNGAHTSTFAVDGEKQPPEDHGNSAHTSTFAVDGEKQPPENHGNGAHTEDYITLSNSDNWGINVTYRSSVDEVGVSGSLAAITDINGNGTAGGVSFLVASDNSGVLTVTDANSNAVARFDASGNLEIAGSVTENVTF